MKNKTYLFLTNSTHEKHHFTRNASKMFKQRSVQQQLFSLIRRWLMHVYALDYHISLESSFLLQYDWKKEEEEEKGEKLGNYVLNQHLIHSILHVSLLIPFFMCRVYVCNLEPHREGNIVRQIVFKANAFATTIIGIHLSYVAKPSQNNEEKKNGVRWPHATHKSSSI